jgi:hypothetical protein
MVGTPRCGVTARRAGGKITPTTKFTPTAAPLHAAVITDPQGATIGLHEFPK